MMVSHALFRNERVKVMPKTIFHTTEKSNFILNMDLDKYRAFCGKLVMLIFWVTAASSAVSQWINPFNNRISEMMQESGFAQILAAVLIALRSIATLFSIGGVLAIIAMVVGMMRLQFTKSTILPYSLLLATLLWGLISMTQSFSTSVSLFGQDGRDEGLIALFMYAALFYLGSMLRRKETQQRFLDALILFGLVQCLLGFLQAQPFFKFPNTFRWIEPLSQDKLCLPIGMTDSPVTFSMLLAIFIAISIPAAFCSKSKKRRVLAFICAGCSMLLTLRTHTFAGLLAACGALVLTAILCITQRKKATGKIWALPMVMVLAAGCSALWMYFTPAINGSYYTSTEAPVKNGFFFCDGGIVWDDGYYRLGTSGPYNPLVEHDFEVADASSVMEYCWKDALRVIRKYPLVGAGPDNYFYTQLRESLTLNFNVNSIDRPYNDYLFVAATRGIPSLILFVALMGVCLIGAWKRRKVLDSWVTFSAMGAVVLYAITAFVGVSVLTVAPVFWTLLGMLAGEPLAGEQPKKAKQKK